MNTSSIEIAPRSESTEGIPRAKRQAGPLPRGIFRTKRSRKESADRGFTLIELLVVVAIIAILMSLLMPALRRGKFVADFATCKTNLKQIASGLILSAADNDGWYLGEGDLFRPRPHDAPSWLGEGAAYFGGEYGDQRDMTWRNPLFRCPAGVREYMGKDLDTPTWYRKTHSGGLAYYSMFPKMFGGVADGITYGQPYIVNNHANMMLRSGDTLTMQGYRNNHGWRGERMSYSILASDICHRGGGGIMTNHIWGGNRWVNQHFSTSPIYWGTTDGQGSVNYVFDDGSVRPYYFTPADLQTEINVGTGGGHGASPYCLPKEFGRSD